MNPATTGDRRTTGADRGNTSERSEPMCVVVSGDETGGRYAIIETLERRGSEPPLHLHTREDEIVYVLEGELTIYLEGEPLDCPSGTCVLLTKGREHTFSVRTEEARLLVLLVPGGMEGYCRNLCVPLNGRDGDGSAARHRDFERLVTVAARCEVEITGPPPGTEWEKRWRMEPG